MACAGGSAPQRFLIYSFRHSGTHFLRDALMSGRNVSIGDEVFMTMQHMEQVLNLTVTQPDQRVPAPYQPPAFFPTTSARLRSVWYGASLCGTGT